MNLHREHLTAECCEALAAHQRAANLQASRWIERELRRELEAPSFMFQITPRGGKSFLTGVRLIGAT